MDNEDNETVDELIEIQHKFIKEQNDIIIKIMNFLIFNALINILFSILILVTYINIK